MVKLNTVELILHQLDSKIGGKPKKAKKNRRDPNDFASEGGMLVILFSNDK